MTNEVSFLRRLVILGLMVLIIVAAQPVKQSVSAQGARAESERLDWQVAELSRQGRYAEAIPLAERLVVLKRQLGEEHNYAVSLNNLGLLYLSTGRYDEAEPPLLQAAEIYKSVFGERDFQYAASLSNLAGLYEMTGRYDEAEPLLLRVAEIFAALGEGKLNYAAGLENLALLYLNTGRYDEAEPLLLQFAEIYKSVLGEGLNYARSLHNLALSYLRTGRYDEAEPRLLQAAQIFATLGEGNVAYAKSLNIQALLYQAKGDFKEALTRLTRGMDIQQNHLQRAFGVSSESAMRAYLSTVSSSFDVLISLTANQPEASAAAIETSLTWSLRRKAIILDTLVRFRQAQLLAQSNPAVAETAARLRSLLQQLSNLPLNRPPGMTDAEFQRRMADMRAESERLEAELNRKLAQLRAEPTEVLNVDAIRRQLPADAALIEFVRVDVYDFKATGKQSPWQPARYYAFVLRRNVAATVRMLDLGEASHIDEAVASLRDSISDSSKFFKGKSPQQVWEAEQDREDGYRQPASKLYSLIFEKLRKELGQATKLYLSPDGLLNLVPFEALVDQEDKYLIESFSFAYLSSGRDLLRARDATGAGTVVFADPSYDMGAEERAAARSKYPAPAVKPAAMAATLKPSDQYHGVLSREVSLRSGATKWERLPETAQEAADIERLLKGSGYGPVQSYLATQSLEDTFKQVRSPRVLHVSTHGFFLADQPDAPVDLNAPMDVRNAAAVGQAWLRGTGAENPLLRSGLVLAGANKLGEQATQSLPVDDGWVTAEEIALMDLRGTELVVLSACETGLGDVRVGEGVYGLRRAFQHAGARTLISTLFKVPSQQSQQIMRKFYEGVKAGRGKLSSLREAQLELIRARRKEGGAAHPFFWAGFVLAGDPN